MMNRAAWLTRKGRIELNTIDMPVPDDDEVVVRVEYVGICGSDMHFYETGNYAKGPVPFPHILGHECAGTITQIGAKVEHLKVGDRVALEPGLACGKCELCRSGRYNLCHEVQFKSVPPYPGVMRDYLTHKASLCFKLPDHMSTLEGAMIEPFAIGLYAAIRAGVQPGKTAVILGTGCIGMMTLLACKALGIDRIAAVDIFDSRLEKAAANGADLTINSTREDCCDTVSGFTNGAMADIVFETAGSAVTLKMAPALCKSGGTIMMVGNVFGEVSFNFWEIAHREVTIKSIYRYCNVYPRAIELVASGKVNLRGLVTDVVDFEESDRAYNKAVNDKEHTLKTIIKLI